MMDMNSEVVHTPPRAAATVVLLRDAPLGPEVFMLKRHGRSSVLAGAHVFPGGKVDALDAGPAALSLLDESQLPVFAEGSRYIAAIREVFEESGVLLAHGVDRPTIDKASAMLREGHAFDVVMHALSLRLDARSLLAWSRWITPQRPTVTNQRFDTLFFVARMPANQTARHDDHEAVDSVWLRPRDALRSYWDGDIDFAPPQIISLAHLSRFPSVELVQQDIRRQRPVLVEPEPFERNGERVAAYPGDPQHSRPLRALLGPTRLTYRNRRFEPPGGFDGFFQHAAGTQPE